MRLINIGIFAALAVALLACAAPALAANTTFSVSGQVIDRYGNPVQGADVMLIDFKYNVISEKKSTENGNYDFINVVSDTDTVSVRVNLTRDGMTYAIPSYYTRWYPSKGMVYIPKSETQFSGYPEPVYGYIYGAIQTDMSASGRFIDGVVYLMSLDDDAKYYEIADRVDGKGSYQFYVPVGNYMLYAQHRENGVVYESARKQVSIRPNNDVSEVLETRIILPLDTPSSSLDPATMPTHHENLISGTVTDGDGKPLAGVAITLYQKADNGTGFLPMRGAGQTPLATTTDNNGGFEFRGVSPTTDDGKAIQARKAVKALIEYRLTDSLTASGWSDEKTLYYPDMILGYGQESQARNVTLSGTISIDGKVHPTVSMSDVPAPAPASGVATVPLLAALAIGLVCLAGFYLAINRKR